MDSGNGAYRSRIGAAAAQTFDRIDEQLRLSAYWAGNGVWGPSMASAAGAVLEAALSPLTIGMEYVRSIRAEQ